MCMGWSNQENNVAANIPFILCSENIEKFHKLRHFSCGIQQPCPFQPTSFSGLVSIVSNSKAKVASCDNFGIATVVFIPKLNRPYPQ